MIPKRPKISFKSSKLMWLMMMSVAVGFIATIFLVATFTTVVTMPLSSAAFPDPADYHVQVEQAKGEEVLRYGQNATHQTLNLLIGGARINNFYFENLEIGKMGLESSFDLFGDSGADLSCETLIIDGLIAPTLTIENGTAHNLVILDNVADGNSFSSILSNVADITFGSTRGSIDIPYVSNSHFDRIVLDSSSADSICNTLTLKNIKAFGGGVSISNFRVGTLLIVNSTIGDGTGIDNPSFIIEDTVSIGNLEINNNIEEPISVQ